MKRFFALLISLALLFSLQCAAAENGVDGPVFKAKKKALEVGDSAFLGSYEQDNNPDNGPEIIEWIVLEVTEDKALLISKYGLDAKPFDDSVFGSIWEHCSLRKWLNDDFMKTAFSEAEQDAILKTTLQNDASQQYSGSSVYEVENKVDYTEDHVFILSYAEANDYFGVVSDGEENKGAMARPTKYAIEKGAETKDYYDLERAGWWLRSSEVQDYSGMTRNAVVYVSVAGMLRYKPAYENGNTVRPALWVELESGFIKNKAK